MTAGDFALTLNAMVAPSAVQAGASWSVAPVARARATADRRHRWESQQWHPSRRRRRRNEKQSPIETRRMAAGSGRAADSGYSDARADPVALAPLPTKSV